LEIEGREW
jgi:hypothetical protein